MEDDTNNRGYGANNYVKENFEQLKRLIIEMNSGELLDLIFNLMNFCGLCRRTAEDYVISSVASKWITISDRNGNIANTRQTLSLLKHCMQATFESNLGLQNIQYEEMRNEIMPKENKQIATAFI